MVRNNFSFIYLVSLFFILFISCSLDYSPAMVAEDLSEKVPETVLINFKQTKVENGKISRQVSASRAENYTKTKQTIFLNVQFLDYDKNGEIVTEGKADKVVYKTDTENAEIYGNIYFYSHTEKTEIFAETLIWKNKEKLLTSQPDKLVRVFKKEDNSFIQGRGFETDLRLKQIVFTNGVSGRYVENKQQNEPKNIDGSDESLKKNQGQLK
jgi:LPS export ABC transporter protein LptC